MRPSPLPPQRRPFPQNSLPLYAAKEETARKPCYTIGRELIHQRRQDGRWINRPAAQRAVRGRGSVQGMNAWLQILLDFVWVSACLALVSFSLGLILGELKIVNIAQGDLMMVGAYSMYTMRDLPFLVALLITVAIGLLLGLVLERGVL